MNKFKKELVDSFKSIQKDDNLIAMALVGSFVDKEKFGKTEDIDLVIVTKRLSDESFIRLKNSIDKICKDMSSGKMKLYAEFKEGPFKPEYKGKQTFMLHIQFNTLERLQNRSRLLLVDWNYNNIPVYGKKLTELNGVRDFDKNFLVNGTDGLNDVKNAVIGKKFPSTTYDIIDGKVVKQKIIRPVKNKEEIFELLQYAVSTSLINMIRLRKPEFKKTEKAVIDYANKSFSKEHSDFVKEIFKLKNEINTKGKADFDVKDLENRTLAFLDYLILKLNK